MNKNDIWKFGTLSVSPFNWLEAGYFYYRPSDLIWEGNLVKGHYLDKGFNVKFIHRPKNQYLPNIAIGLDDFAGTGFFSREYIVSTLDLDSFQVTLGLGWGKFAGDRSFKNPFSFVSEKLLERPLTAFETGTPAYNQWFRGEASIFGGIEYQLPKIKGLKLKIEYDPYDYFDFSANNREDLSIDRRKKDSNINVGISLPINKFFTIDTSLIKGNTFNFNIAFTFPFKKELQKKPKFKPDVIKNTNGNSKKAFYDDLLFNLNRNNLLLQTATLVDEQNLDIAISTSQHRNAIRSSSYAANIAKTVLDNNDLDVNQINVTHINAGIELNKISYISDYLLEENDTPIELVKRNTDLDSGKPFGYLDDEFQPTVPFPVVFSSISPALVSHIGNPEKFYFGGIDIQHVSEVQFSRNLLMSSEINLSIYDNFQATLSGPQSNMEHVRTDLLQYLREDDIHITRLQLDYIWSPLKNTYAKISGGIFEDMYGGFGFEAIHKPFKRNFFVGVEVFNVKKRSFNQRFDFEKYKTTTGHLNLGYIFNAGVEANLSFGRYLAKDDGYTLDLSRRLNSGFKAGIYFTRTNVSAELFGEGSFDKGFYFQMPIDLFSKEYSGNYSTFKVTPLTRDGGAKLIYDKDLRGLIYNSTSYEISNQWSGFLK